MQAEISSQSLPKAALCAYSVTSLQFTVW